MTKSDRVYLIHIVEAAQTIKTYAGSDSTRFFNDPMCRDAIIKHLANIAESAGRLDEKTQQICPDIPWGRVAGFRNILVHNYLGDLNYQRVWNVMEQDLDALVKAARHILKEKYATDV